MHAIAIKLTFAVAVIVAALQLSGCVTTDVDAPEEDPSDIVGGSIPPQWPPHYPRPIPPQHPDPNYPNIPAPVTPCLKCHQPGSGLPPLPPQCTRCHNVRTPDPIPVPIPVDTELTPTEI